MALIVTSFLAGVLTIAAPCVLPLLPVIIGGSVSEKDKKKPIIIILSLSISLVVFTLLLKASTLLIDISASFWASISGSIILFFGVITLFPNLWETISEKFNLGSSSQSFLQQSTQKKGNLGSILIGAALGPVFSSCSPTYALIVATILPQSFFVGLINIISYVLGLAVMLLLIAIYGQKLVTKMKWLADPNGKFKKVLGAIFILVGLAVLTGIDKEIETYLVENEIYKVSEFETNLLENTQQLN